MSRFRRFDELWYVEARTRISSNGVALNDGRWRPFAHPCPTKCSVLIPCSRMCALNHRWLPPDGEYPSRRMTSAKLSLAATTSTN